MADKVKNVLQNQNVRLDQEIKLNLPIGGNKIFTWKDSLTRNQNGERKHVVSS